MADPSQADDFFRSYGARTYGSVYDRGSPVPRGPSLFGLHPSAPSGPLEGALQAVMPMVSEFMRTNLGYNGYGFNFGSDMNISSAQFARDFLRQMQDARTMGAAADRSQVEDLLRGVAVAIGHQSTGTNARGMAMFAPEIEKSISRMSGDAQAMLPFLAAMFPDTIDRLMPRGSMAVAAQSFVNAGRFVIDPTTGRPVSESPGFAAAVLNPLMDSGPERTAGLRAGRLGQTFEELVKLGFIGSGRDLLEGAGPAMGAGGGAAGRSAIGDVQKTRIIEKLEAYSQSIAAINDIFAENGRPDAPMSQLIKSLQQLTQGGLNTYDAQTLARITRSLHGASQLSGIGLEGLTELGVGAGSLLSKYGGHRGLAPYLALFGAASGQTAADLQFLTPSPEGMSRDEFIASQMQRRAAGAGSPAGNTIGAILAQSKYAAAGTPIKAVAAALASGQSAVDVAGYGRFDLTTATMADYEKLFQSSGLTVDAFRSQLMASFTNKAMLVNFAGSQGAIDQAQAAEYKTPLLNMFGALMETHRKGIAQPTGDQFWQAAIEAADQGGFTSDVEFAQAIGAKLGLSQKEISDLGPKLTLIPQLKGMSAYNALRAFGPKAQAEISRNLARYDRQGDILKALSPLARGGTIANIANAINFIGQHPNDPDYAEAALKAFGLVQQTEVDAALKTIGGGELAKPAAGAQSAVPGKGGMNIRVDKATVVFDRGGGMSISAGGALIAPGGK